VTAAPKDSEAQARNSTHILIVDDDREAGKSLALMLSATGYDEIKTVRSAARALAIATTFQPAIAFLGTPQADGGAGELATQLQKSARPQGIRVIALTDSAEHPGRDVARAAGLERYLTRPVTQAELDKVLRRTP
jgi:CheY-like chemotaxis protein